MPENTVARELDGVGKRYRLGEHHGAGMDLRETAWPGSVIAGTWHATRPLVP